MEAPKEKAKALVDKIMYCEYESDGIRAKRMPIHDAKQCALICVDEMMKIIPPNIDPMVYMPILSELQQVKQEIEKL